jgi:polysaccharide export outer membrane protein
MKITRILRKFIIALAGCLVISMTGLAQKEAPVLKDAAAKNAVITAAPATALPEATPGATPDIKGTDTSSTPNTGKTDDTATPEEVAAEEAYVKAMYASSILRDYKLGPEDVITVEVFGQCPNYCVTGKTVPPTGRISYPLIKEGVFVAGRTVEEVAAEITKKLDEYIIDPKVNVTLDKAMSARYSVMGDVRSPGVKPMARRVSILDAISEAGGVAETGSKKNVLLLRMGTDGRLVSQTINLGSIEKGKGEVIFLAPGDQVIVQGNMFSKIRKFTDIFSFLSFARTFTP